MGAGRELLSWALAESCCRGPVMTLKGIACTDVCAYVPLVKGPLRPITSSALNILGGLVVLNAVIIEH